MADNVMSSYLVSLGFHIDDAEVRKFNGTLRGVAHEVDFYTGGMVKEMFKWQTSIVSGFAAVGGAMLGLMDHVATADQGYRLMAMHMFITKDAARALSMATDALGVSIQDAIWDPELRARLDKFLGVEKKMFGAFGEDSDTVLKRMRDVKSEFQQFKLEAKVVSIELAESLFKAVGGNDNTLIDKLEGWNNWIVTHGPEITKFFTDHLVPVWKDFVHVGKDVGVMLKDAGLAFTNIMGAITGDKGIEGNAFSFEKFATAIDHAADGLTKFVDAGTKAFGIVTNLASAGAEYFSGDKKDASDSLHAAKGNVTKGSLAILGAALLGTALGTKVLTNLGGKMLGVGGKRGESPGEPIFVSDVSGGGKLGKLGEIGIAAAALHEVDKFTKKGGALDKWQDAHASTNWLARWMKNTTEYNRAGKGGSGFSHTWGSNSYTDLLEGRTSVSEFLAGKSSTTTGSSSGGGTAATGSGLDKLAQAIAYGGEGFGVKGAKPTRLHNPGDLTDSSGNIRTFASDEEGWAGLMAQLNLIVSGKSKAYGKNAGDMTLEQFGKKYTATDQAAWLANVTKRSGFSKDTKLSDIANGTAGGGQVTVTVNVANAAATPEQIAAATKEGVHQALKTQHTQTMAEVQGGYAGGG